jgi:hypothetical protein
VVLIKINKWMAGSRYPLLPQLQGSADHNDHGNLVADQISRAGYDGNCRDAVQSSARSVRTSRTKIAGPF